MKNFTLVAALILCGTAAFAQVGINTSTPSAALDIRSANQAAPSNTDGLLIPKIDAFPAVNPTAAQQGMMVYLTTTSGTNQPGFYFWDDTTTSWASISASGKGWDVNGNAGTNPASNFLGTADAQPLALKTNGAERMRIDTNGNVGVGASSPQSKFHVMAGATGMTPNPGSVATIESNNPGTYFSMLSAGESGVLFGSNGNSTNGAIVYNNPGLLDAMLFRTNGNINRMIIGPTGNVGLGNFVPNYPLHFPATVGDKIGLWGGAGVHYGIGVQNNLLQIHADTAASDVAFGYGTSAAMTETMRIKGNGRLGVGTSAPNARMEVAASNAATPANTDGLLIPKVNAFPAMNPTAAQNGMLVFLTTTAGAFQPGFYYWNNATTSWKGIGSSGTPNDWGLSGNAGTAAANNFIGTTDDNDLIFKRNNIRAGIIGTSNTGFGKSSLNPATTGANNTAIGSNSLAADTSGFRNTAIGSYAMASQTTGSYNTAVGTSALVNSTTGGSNTAIGDTAMVGNIGGTFNVGVGNNTLTANTEGSGNTALGHRAMFANITGNQNTAVGMNSLYNNLASGIVGVGMEALAANTTGQYNTATGSFSLHNNQTGGYNTATGYNALYNNTGDYNTANGVNALLTNTSGHSNTSIGYRSLYHNDAASFNTAVGDAAMYENISGANNSVLGQHALRANTSGSNNVVAGMNAVYNNPSGSDNTALGYQSMASMISGSGNTAIGSGAMGSQGTGDNNIAIGKNAAFPQALGSNQLSIGNVIYGSGIDAAATSKIGIGKATPDAKFDIAASNTATPSNTDGLLIPRISAFPVANPMAAQNGMMVFLTATIGFNPAGFYYWDNAAVSWVGVGTKNNWSTSGNAGINPAVQYIGTSDNNDVSLRANGTEAMRLEVGGNVGIGVNNPTTKLEVNGFTKLGSNAPAIKNLKLTGTTASTQGSQVGIAHGLSSAKILSVSVMVEWSSGQWIPASYGASSGYEFDYFVSGTAIQVINKTSNSASILSKPVKILVTYEE